MAPVRLEPRYDIATPVLLAPDHGKVLVVGNSQINRIVVSRIVERCGLRPVADAPLGAVRVLPLLFPGLIVMDGGASNRECECLVGGIMALRRLTGRAVPAVILLTNRNTENGDAADFGTVDAIVTKPFTTEQLQPLMERLVQRNRSA